MFSCVRATESVQDREGKPGTTPIKPGTLADPVFVAFELKLSTYDTREKDESALFRNMAPAAF